MIRPEGGRGLTVLVLAESVEVALPACRSLARNGHEVGAAASTRRSPVLAGVDRGHLWTRVSGMSARQDMCDAAVAGRGSEVVLACNDVDVRLVSTAHVVAGVPSVSPSQAVV